MRNNIIKTIVICIMTISMLSFLSSCNILTYFLYQFSIISDGFINNNDNYENTNEIIEEIEEPIIVKLATPNNVIKQNCKVWWSPVDNATGYRVKFVCPDETITIFDTSEYSYTFIYPMNGEYFVSVMAISSITNYSDSDYSDSIRYEVQEAL